MNVFAVTEGVLIPRMKPERWEELKSFPLRADDVILSCYPRSGTTWTQHIMRLLRNGGRDDGVNLDDAVPWLEVLGTPKGNMMGLTNTNAPEELPSPRLMKVHVPYHMTPGGQPHTTGIKYIYVARNPKDVCVSFWHFSQTEIKKFTGEESSATNMSIPWDSFFADFLEGKNGASIYGGWLNHVLEWWKRRDEPNILFLRFEDMRKDPHKAVRTIAEFIGVESLTDELVETVIRNSSFQSMAANPTVNDRKKEGAKFGITFLRKGIVGDWKNHFTAEQSREFDEKIGKTLEENGLIFDYE
jgi:hypothetical protein